MDGRSWCNSGDRNVGCGRRYVKGNYNRFESLNLVVIRSKKLRWRMLWRKIMKEKKKFFGCSIPVNVPYDPYTYSQNFDQGSTWADPDNLSRSFSARFAVPSKIFSEEWVDGLIMN